MNVNWRRFKPGQSFKMQSNSMVSCQKGPTRHAYAWQIGPFWQDTLELFGKWPDHEYGIDFNGTINT